MSAKKKVVFKFDERSYEAGPSELPAGSELAPARGYTARLEQLKSELNERRLTEIAAMLDDVGVPEWVENNSHRGVPSNSAVMRLRWYLARRKNVAAREIDQKLQREMKEAEANAREYMGRYNWPCATAMCGSKQSRR